MRVLLVYPEFPDSFWSFRGTLRFVNKRSAMPPLGLITIAVLLSREWDVRLIDMNIEKLTTRHLLWADLVFVSAMLAQKESFIDVIRTAHIMRCRVVVGGPFPTSYYDEIERSIPRQVDHYFFGEAEETIPQFVADLANGVARRIYDAPRTDGKPQTDVSKSPTPRFELLDLDAYSCMAIQWSRGCPFDCEFCDITAMFGRIPRLKSIAQILAELQALYDVGWRGPIFFVDDNFIGNKKLVGELLKEISRWQAEHGFPFSFFTEASIDLALYPELLKAMRLARFSMIFTGIESVSEEALKIMHKGQNLGRAMSPREKMLADVRLIQSAGIEVSAGFIIGLDGDTEYGSLVEFIEEAGIPMAMVGLLSPLRNTRLYDRLQQEGRLINDGVHTGNNSDAILTYVTKLPADRVMEDYKNVLRRLYGRDLRSYFRRCLVLLEHLGPRAMATNSHRPLGGLPVLLRSLVRQLSTRHGPTYALFLLRVLLTRPRSFPEAVEYAVKGYHFEKFTRTILKSK